MTKTEVLRDKLISLLNEACNWQINHSRKEVCELFTKEILKACKEVGLKFVVEKLSLIHI